MLGSLRMVRTGARSVFRATEQDMDPISMVYTGKPFPFRSPGRVTLVIAIDTVRYGTLPFAHTPG